MNRRLILTYLEHWLVVPYCDDICISDILSMVRRSFVGGIDILLSVDVELYL